MSIDRGPTDEATREAGHLQDVARADWSHRHAQRLTGRLLGGAALLGVAPWLASLRPAWLPAIALRLATALWGAALSMTLAARLNQWRLKRDLERCIARREEP